MGSTIQSFLDNQGGEDILLNSLRLFFVSIVAIPVIPLIVTALTSSIGMVVVYCTFDDKSDTM